MTKKLTKKQKQFAKILDTLEWYALICDINSDEILQFNIFNSYHFYEGVLRTLSEENLTFDEFTERIKGNLRYSFWSKYEYETVISPMSSRGEYKATLSSRTFIIEKNWYHDENEDVEYECRNSEEFDKNKIVPGEYRIKSTKMDKSKKIDVYEQVVPNITILAKYIIDKTGYITVS